MCEAEGEPQYFAKFTINDESTDEVRITSTEEQARLGSEAYDLNPVIFVRTSRKSANALDVLPAIKLTDFFTQATEDEAVVFDMKRAKMTSEDLDLLEIKDEASRSFLQDLTNFTSQQDS